MASYLGNANNVKQYAVEGVEAVCSPSVNQCADRALESSGQARSYVEKLWAELRQVVPGLEKESPCRCGIDGKLLDSQDHSDATMRVLQEIRQYLLG